MTNKSKAQEKDSFINKRMTAYDDFKCIADKCKFTCCTGWDINIDDETHARWGNEKKCNHMLDKIKVRDYDSTMIINKRTDETCPFLDNKGLCEIVKNNGDEYLSLTCQSFPRIENVFEGIRELTLSCACPEVIDILGDIKGKIVLKEDGERAISDLPTEIKIRDTIVKILREDGLSIEDKLIISYNMILDILNSEELTEEIVLKEISKYEKRQYIDNLQKGFGKATDYNKSIRTLNNLLLDIIENYKKVPVLEDSLREVSKASTKIYRGQIKIDNLLNKWNDFSKDFHKYNVLLENCIVSKVLGGCINEDIEEIAISLELIILEYLLVRYCVFIKMYIDNNEGLLQNIKEYIMVFSRIIGNNSDAVIDYIEEEFGDIFLEVEYLELLSIMV